MSEENQTTNEAVKSAANIVIEAVLGNLQDDPHQWSTRPCPTCRTISAIVGKPFGCYHFQKYGRKAWHNDNE